MGVLIAFVLSRASTAADVSDLTDAIGRMWQGFPEVSNLKRDQDQISFEVDGMLCVLQWVARSVPRSDEEPMLSASTMWPDAADVFDQSQGHWIVVASGDGAPLDRARLLTQVVAALLETDASTTGLMWGGAGTLIRKDVFVDYAAQMLPSGPALHLWIDFRVGEELPGRASGFTRGLDDLGHHELEAKDAPRTAAELYDLFEGIAAYLLENGPGIHDGDTVGADENERIVVRLSASEFGLEGDVMRLEFESA